MWSGILCHLIVTEPEPDYRFPETMGDDYSDDDVAGMGGVSEHCLCNMVVMLTYKILLLIS